MRIIIDGMGGDNAPSEIVKGVVDAAALIDHEIHIVGDEKKIEAELAKYKYKKEQIKIVHASDVITNDDAPVKAVRTKQDSSLVKGINLLKSGGGELFISAGNTGAIMAAGLFILGRIQGIDRPAIASTYPILGKGVSLLVDSGANAECKPNNLLEFAAMGSIYMEKVLNVKKPTVGLVNMGTEENKGPTVLKAAHELLSKSSTNFVGNIEARDVPKGICDVIVCDGFIGNVILKLTEGLAWNILKLLKNKFTDGMLPKMGALLLSSKLKELKSEFDYSEYGGAPILGVKGAVVKMHGSSNANAVKNTILKGIPYAENNVVQTIQNSVLELEEIIISE
ncbi:phosphate acyltransferase PlsX [Sinanaerobacter chloroacetimidivorans]|jgi:glycerol-3-phosphate acyltransferase PlsX|uniref:Phosphate acyltransferase n=1 Tax=Sinanaerobacter chloroacetimidivorans TaxID=2818044 RepID=A0A8J7W428_9FIRM|nr:phosphate acyltransferase PlsX [Sinanaerobacter chloroacetimidivorans]MBR0598845.1 phosphate acyltransferase PlsX [Sinanaerobacter chloroacetimidivorans]